MLSFWCPVNYSKGVAAEVRRLFCLIEKNRPTFLQKSFNMYTYICIYISCIVDTLIKKVATPYKVVYPTIVVNGVIYNPYKWPKINRLLGWKKTIYRSYFIPFTPSKINMEHNHVGLVQILFLSKCVMAVGEHQPGKSSRVYNDRRGPPHTVDGSEIPNNHLGWLKPYKYTIMKVDGATPKRWISKGT